MEEIAIKSEFENNVFDIKQEVDSESDENEYTSSNDERIAPVCVKTEHDREEDVQETPSFTFMDVTKIKHEIDIEEHPLQEGHTNVLYDPIKDLKTESKLSPEGNPPLEHDVQDMLDNYLNEEKIKSGIPSENQIVTNSSSNKEIFPTQQKPVRKKNPRKLNGIVKKSPECNICNKKFKRLDNMTRHMRTHTGEKPYKCNICTKAFGDSTQLSNHLFKHSGEKPHKCDVCNKKFSLPTNLMRHKQIHTGEKPYQCTICQKKFTRKFILDMHLMSHTGDKPYECNICNKKFSQSSNLATHMRLHTGERPHECNICNKKFTRKGNLQTHRMTHTEETSFEFYICK